MIMLRNPCVLGSLFLGVLWHCTDQEVLLLLCEQTTEQLKIQKTLW